MTVGALSSLLHAETSGHESSAARWLIESFTGQQTTAGVNVTSDKALTVTGVFACVRNLAEDEAKLPLITYRELGDNGRERAKELPLYRVLRWAFNNEMTAFSGRQAITAMAVLYGTGYAEIVRDNTGQVVALVPLKPSRVSAKRRDNGDLYYEVRADNSMTVEAELEPQDMFVLPGFSMNGIVGEMVATAGREMIGACIAADQFASSFFGNGTNPGGVIVYPGGTTPEKRTALRESIARQHGGPRKGNRVLLLWDQMTFTPVQMDLDKAQALESRKWNTEEVARWFRMPPDKIGYLAATKGWNTQELGNIAYLTDTLLPWFVRWEQEIKRKCVTADDVYAEHLVDGLLRLDAKTRAEVNQIRFQCGTMSIDEWRRLENENPIGGEAGKARFVMANLTTVDKAIAEPVEPAVVRGASGNAMASAAMPLCRKEANALLKAADKHAGKPSDFAAWCGEFYAEHRKQLLSAMLPAAIAYAAAMGISIATDTVEQAVASIIVRHESAAAEAFAGGTMAAHCHKLQLTGGASISLAILEAVDDA